MMLDEEIMASYLAYRDGVLAEADKKVRAMEEANKQLQAAVRKSDKQVQAVTAKAEKQVQAAAAKAEKQVQAAATKADKQKVDAAKGFLKANVPPKVIAANLRMPLKRVMQIQAAMTP